MDERGNTIHISARIKFGDKSARENSPRRHLTAFSDQAASQANKNGSTPSTYASALPKAYDTQSPKLPSHEPNQIGCPPQQPGSEHLGAASSAGAGRGTGGGGGCAPTPPSAPSPLPPVPLNMPVECRRRYPRFLAGGENIGRQVSNGQRIKELIQVVRRLIDIASQCACILLNSAVRRWMCAHPPHAPLLPLPTTPLNILIECRRYPRFSSGVCDQTSSESRNCWSKRYVAREILLLTAYNYTLSNSATSKAYAHALRRMPSRGCAEHSGRMSSLPGIFFSAEKILRKCFKRYVHCQ